MFTQLQNFFISLNVQVKHKYNNTVGIWNALLLFMIDDLRS